MALAREPSRAAFLVSFLFDETDFGAYRQAIESAVENGVAVKIDLASVRRLDEAAVLPGQELCHPAMIFRDVLLDLAAISRSASSTWRIASSKASRMATPGCSR